MAISTSNIGFNSVTGSFERYAPPKVVEAGGGGHVGPPLVDTTVVNVAAMELVPPGIWLVVSGTLQVNTAPDVPGQIFTASFPAGFAFVSNGTNVRAQPGPVTLYQVRG